jgi:AraC-like DNA-binding protein
VSQIGPYRPAGRRPSAASWGLRNLLDVLERRGADASAVRHAAGLEESSLDDPDYRVDAVRSYRAWEAAVAVTGEPDLGLLVAGAQPAGAFDLLEYAFRASPTLGRAFEQLARYRRVVRDDLEVTLAEQGGRATVAFTLGQPGPLLRQQANYFLFGWLRIARDATGRDDLAPLETRVPYPAPDSVLRIERAFGGPVVYESPDAAFVFDREAMALGTLRPDPGLLRVLRQRLSRLEPPPAGAGPFAAAVRSHVEEDLPSGEVTAARVAAEMGLSVRTLDRRLATEGTSFRGVLDGVRRELALQLLRDPRATTGEIAFHLGYSESTAFHRSFKRWTGLTPRAFRRQASAL